MNNCVIIYDTVHKQQMKGAYMQIFEDDTFVLGGIETEGETLEGAIVVPDNSKEAQKILAQQGMEKVAE